MKSHLSPNNYFVVLAFLAVLGTVWSSSVLADCELAKLLASDGEDGDEFGVSVSISGDTAVIGADWDDDNGDDSGSAYIFQFNGSSWVEKAKLLASDGEEYDGFGWSVGISGDIAVIAAPDDIANGYISGSAYIFAPNAVDPNNWDEVAKLVPSDGWHRDWFGFEVGISGDTIIIGSPCDDDNGSSSGSVYVFTPNDVDPNNWDQVTKLLASDGASPDSLGQSVGISGNIVIAGAPEDSDNGYKSGSAYIFALNDVDPNNWVQLAKLLPSDGAENDYFGCSVDISGDTAIIGALRGESSDSGSAYIFAPNEVDPNNWDQVAKLLPSDGAANDYFGFSVGISGDTAVIGAISGDGNDTDSGSVYIFRFNGSSWVEEAKLTASDGAAGDDFGWSISFSGNTAFIGAWIDDDNGADSGSAYIFGLSRTPGDLDFDDDVDFKDFSLFAAHWLETDCGLCSCDRADFTGNGQVDSYDLKELCDNWLQ